MLYYRDLMADTWATYANWTEKLLTDDKPLITVFVSVGLFIVLPLMLMVMVPIILLIIAVEVLL